MKKRRLCLAVIGFGQLGKACLRVIQEADDLELAGVVRRHDNVIKPLPEPFSAVPVAAHIRELKQVEVALICVPTAVALGTSCELLQYRIPIVECASLEGNALQAHYEEINRVAENHHTTAVVGAGWQPGIQPLMERLFTVLIPHGHTKITNHTGLSLHHTLAAAGIKGVKDALCTELRNDQGKLQRYVYVELETGADSEEVTTIIRNDPLFLDEETLVFPAVDLSALQNTHGLVMERYGHPGAGQSAHQSLLFEARFDATIPSTGTNCGF